MSTDADAGADAGADAATGAGGTGQTRASEHTRTDAFLAAACDAVGGDNVLTGITDLRRRRDPFAVASESPLPTAVVQPGDTAEVQRVVRAAAATGMRLWPVSRGRNLAYGGGAPRSGDAVTLDLSRMRRICEVDEDLAYAVVEPGVSYDQLDRHLRKAGSRLWVDVPDLAWGSVVGNALERGNGYTALGDHWAAHCGMQVVLADGELLHTGMWALPGAQTGPLFPYGYGPYLDGLFSQSGLGVVTRMGVHLQPDPGGYLPFTVTVPTVESLAPLVDVTRELRLAGVLPGVANIRSTLAEAAIVSTRHDYPGAGPVDAATLERLVAEHGAWRLYGALYGPPDVVDVAWKRLAVAYAGIDGADLRDATGSSHHRTAMTMRGTPNFGELKQLRWLSPDGGHINVSPVAPARGADAMRLWELVSSRTREAGIDPMATVIVGMRELHHIALIPLDPLDSSSCGRAGALARQLIDETAAAGWGVYRTHLSLMDRVMDTYSADGHALRRVNERLKAALDPGGILAPGKQGIWLPAAGAGDADTGADTEPAETAHTGPAYTEPSTAETAATTADSGARGRRGAGPGGSGRSRPGGGRR